MQQLNVTFGDSRDKKNLKRFFPFEPKDHIIPRPGKKTGSYYAYTKWDEVVNFNSKKYFENFLSEKWNLML